MGMLIHHTWQAQQAMKEPEVTEEIPFTEPEEDIGTLVEEPEKKTVRKTTATNRRRKTAK